MAKLSGGDKLGAALSDIAKNVDKAASVEVGFLANSTYPDGTPTAMIAAIQEFGAPARNIPPRPFFRGMITAKSGEWPAAVANLLKANDYDSAVTLDQTGAAIAGQLRQSIVDFTSPPLSPKTIAKKGFDKPLVDTGHMLASIDHVVKE
jgi:hypothetical protein